MTDLLKPDEVREMQRIIDEQSLWPYEQTSRLCRNYLTLWDELEHERDLSDKAVERVTQLEQEIGALMR